MLLSKEAILSAKNAPPETVEVPEWGGSVCVKVMTAAEREAYEDAVYDDEGTAAAPHPAVQLLVRTVCDDSGKLLFGADDVAALAAKDAPVLMRLYRIARKVNKIGREFVEADAKNS